MFSSSQDLSSVQFEEILGKLGEITLRMHQLPDLDAVLEVGVMAVRELLGSDRALVYQLLPAGDGVVLAESVGADTPAIVGRPIYDPRFERQWIEPYRQGRTSAIDDIAHSTLEPCYIELLRQLQVQANLVAPIVLPAVEVGADSQLWGLLILHECHQPRTWQPLHHQVLKHMGTHIGLALGHHQTRQQLWHSQQQETRWRTALEAAEDGVWDWNAATNEVVFSREWKSMLGYAEDEIGNTLGEWSSRVHPDDLEQVYAAINHHFAGHTPTYRSEHRVRAKDGSWRWILDRGKVLTWQPDGTPLRVVGTHVDITAQKQTEQQVQLQSAALEGCAGVMMITDCHGDIEWVNPAFETLTGYRIEEVMGKNPRDMIKSGQQDKAFYHHLWQQILRGQVWRGELVNRRKDGSLYHEAMTITPIRNQQGHIQHFVAIKQDVSDRHHMEQQLRQRDEMLRKISAQVPGVIFQYRLYPGGESSFPYASEAIHDIYEVTPEQVKTSAQPILDRLHPEDHDRVIQGMWRSFDTLALWHDEYRVCLPVRGLRWVEGHAMPERLEDGSVLWHGYIWDITERKHMAATLEQEVQQERMLTLIEHHIGETLDVKTILQTTVEEVRQFLATDRVLIYRLQPNWSGMVMAESVAPGWRAILAQEITDSYFVETQGGSYHDHQVNVVDDIYTAGFSDCHLELLAWAQVRAKLVVPILQREHLWGLLIAHHCQGPRQWQSSESRLLQQLAHQLAFAIQRAELHDQLQAANQELEQLSKTDALTQVNNRRCFDQNILYALHQAQWANQSLALVLCDIDYFKLYNDTYGHTAGDACLTTVAQTLQQCLKRPTDSLARYGGEEFAMLLPNTDLPGAVAVVQEMQRAIAMLKLGHTAHPTSPWVTLSFGITALVPGSQSRPQTLLDQADQALYQAKAAGRNGYCCFAEA